MPLSINSYDQLISSNQLCYDKLYFSLKFSGNAQYVCEYVCECMCGYLKLPCSQFIKQFFPLLQF